MTDFDTPDIPWSIKRLDNGSYIIIAKFKNEESGETRRVTATFGKSEMERMEYGKDYRSKIPKEVIEKDLESYYYATYGKTYDIQSGKYVNRLRSYE